MTQEEIDQLIAEKKPLIQLLVDLSDTDYLMLRYEIGLRWLEMLHYNKMRQLIISKCETFWVWYHVLYLGRDIKILKHQHRYDNLTRDEIREAYIIDHLEGLPKKIPHTVMHEILLDARELFKIKRLMNKIRARLSRLVECDYEAIKKDARQMWQDINPSVIIVDETWNIMWHEMEQIIKAYADKENPTDDDFVKCVGDAINYYMPEEMPKAKQI